MNRHMAINFANAFMTDWYTTHTESEMPTVIDICEWFMKTRSVKMNPCDAAIIRVQIINLYYP